MRALVVEHDELSVPGMLGAYAGELGIGLDAVVPSAGEAFPHPADYDLVMMMGAPWSVYDLEIEHWTSEEEELVREALDAGVPFLGICFGAQLVSQALGGEVRKAASGEYGWAPVETLAPAVIPAGPWLHWHGDTFTVPPGAELLARTGTGPQAYRLGTNLCVQFHPEVDRATIEPWVEMSEDLLRANDVDPGRLLVETERREPEARRRARSLFDHFLEGVREA